MKRQLEKILDKNVRKAAGLELGSEVREHERVRRLVTLESGNLFLYSFPGGVPHCSKELHATTAVPFYADWML